MSQRSLVFLIVVVLVTGLAGGCRKAPVDTTPVVEAPPTPPPPPPEPEPPKEVVEDFPPEPVKVEPAPPTVDELNRQGVLRTVYFDYDRYDLDGDDRATLQSNAEWLRNNPAHTIVVEGHCDERGTIEYNLALGEKRAKTVRDYLTSLGVPAERMRIVSYGEERPVVKGRSESAWSKNRRAEFLIES